MPTSAPKQPKWMVPEIVQSSAMDCGPATLKCLLEGFGISVSYDRLREACQTSVDGTSIDTLEEVALQLGLEAEQVVVPADHVLLPQARTLPALIVVRLPSGLAHFVVAWRAHRRLVQVMDPAAGRRWVSHRAFVDQLYLHEMTVAAAQWHEWAQSEDFGAPFAQRLIQLGSSAPQAELELERARRVGSWQTLAALDAAARMVQSLVHARSLPPGRHAIELVRRLSTSHNHDQAPDQRESIPQRYWSALPAESDAEGDDQVLIRGAVLVRVLGRRSTPFTQARPRELPTTCDVSSSALTDDLARPIPAEQLPIELLAALKEQPLRPVRELWRLLRLDGLLAPTAVAIALLLASAGVMIEALIFRALFYIGYELDLPEQRLGAMSALGAFIGAIAMLEVSTSALVRRMGRQVETRLRHLFLQRVAGLPDSYFGSRLTSDMAERSHSIHAVRDVAEVGGAALRTLFSLLLTGAGLVWLDRQSLPAVLVAVIVATALPFAVQPLMRERDLRVRGHQGSLTRFYLEAVRGLIPLRTHGATPAIRREHQGLLREWVGAYESMLQLAVPIEGIIALAGTILAGILLLGYVSRSGEHLDLLLFVYWALSLPALGAQLAAITACFPPIQNLTQRLLEPIAASGTNTDAVSQAMPTLTADPRDAGGAPAVRFIGISLNLGGRQVLEAIDLEVRAGEHLAIVGHSGAGKSSLVGLLLGWYTPAAGRITCDGAPLDSAALDRLRRQTAWVDPSVQLWNRSVLANLRYGACASAELPFAHAVEAADLHEVLKRLPDGLQSYIGEGGALVSGGEGQRMRLARALMRPNVRLVILDEPFRGLDRNKRRQLLKEVRRWWQHTTLICITHDIEHTTDFDRVAVINKGHLAEVHPPAALATDKQSIYRAMLLDESHLRQNLWAGSTTWRRLWLENGELREPGLPKS